MQSLFRDGPTVPPSVSEVVRSLQGPGQSAWLVGASLHQLARGEAPVQYEVATSRDLDDCLRRHANAVPTRLEDETITIPSSAGPIDVTPYRNGPEVGADLPFRDFTVHAMAYDPVARAWLDPFDGLADLAQQRLRAVRSATDRLDEAPLRALRAARLCGRFGYRPDAELLEAARACAGKLKRIGGMSVRWELSRLLRERGAERGLGLLHETGLAQALFSGARAEASGGVERLPLDLAARLAWILRGTRPSRSLRRLGFGRITAARVQQILQHHPIEAQAKEHSEIAVRRLLRRLAPDDLAALQQMRDLELESGDAAADPERRKLETLRATIARVRKADADAATRPPLALRGSDVMQILDCGPGPHIGRALAFLREFVTQDRERNQPDVLRDALLSWSRAETGE